MSVHYEYDVFISFTDADRTAAERICSLLREAGLNPYFFREAPKSDDWHAKLRPAMNASRNALFLVSPAWVGGAVSQHEYGMFEPGARRTRVNVLRGRFADWQPPVWIAKTDVLEWPDDADPDAKLWELFCRLEPEADSATPDPARWGRVLRGKENGPWPRVKTTDPGVTAGVARRLGVEDAWACDRDDQWGGVTDAMAMAGAAVIFVLGPRRHGQEYLLNRIESSLPRDPPRMIVSVDDGPELPRDRGEFRARLARALRVDDEARLARDLKDRLAEGNVVIVHRPVTEQAVADGPFVSMYVEWLPELVRETQSAPRVREAGSLKVMQGLAWAGGGGLVASLAGALGLARKRASSTESAAADALRTVQAKAPGELTVEVTATLGEITREHVVKWWRRRHPDRRDEAEKIADDIYQDIHNPDDVYERIVQRYARGEARP